MNQILRSNSTTFPPVACEPLSFKGALAPLGVERFIKDYFEERPLFLARDKADYHQALISLDEIEQYLEIARPSYERVFPIQEKQEIEAPRFTNAKGEIDCERLFSFFDQGATIVLRDVREDFLGLRSLCRSAEKALNHPIDANVYWSPPSGRSFPIHYDACDVFALQISGSKRWRVYVPKSELPLRNQHCAEAIKNAELIGDFTLHAGDLLYIPRGFPHLVDALDDPSLHVSLASFPYTWADALDVALKNVFAANSAFRRALPPGFYSQQNGMRDEFHRLAELFAESASFDNALDSIIRRLVSERPATTEGSRERFEQAKVLSPQNWLASDPDNLFTIDVESTAITLTGRNRQICFVVKALPTLEFALTQPHYRIDAAPGELDSEAKIDLMRTLLANGFVSLASEPD